MHKLRTKLLFSLIAIAIVALILSSGFTVLLSADTTSSELKSAERELIALARRLNAHFDMSLDEISSVLSSYSMYRLIAADNPGELDSKDLMRLRDGDVITRGWETRTRTYFILDDRLMIVSANARNILTVRTALQGYLNVGSTVLIAFAFLCVFGMRMMRPIIDVSEAMRRIAMGDFDARVAERETREEHMDQLERLVADFNQMAEDLKNIAYLRRDFTSNISHEVKTPIAAISGYAQLMESDALAPSERKNYASLIRVECQRLTKLSDNLLRITRIESRKQTPTFQLFALDEQIRRLIANLMPRIRKANLTVNVSLAPVSVQSDSDLLSQVWINLIDNAIKFTPEGGQIDVKLSSGDKGVTVSVSDSGIGMTEETIPRVFDKFYQADNSRKTEGNGLGLALVKRILDIVGGTIDVKSAPGKGSRFTVTLPNVPATHA